MQWRTCPCYTSMSLLTVLHDRRLILQLSSAVLVRQCDPRGQPPWLSDLATSGGLQSISNCSISMRSATWALLRQLRMHVCCRAPTLETCCNAKWKRKESQNLRIDIGFEEMAALKHSLKIALHVYDALQTSLCFACRRSIPTEERRNIGLGYFKYGLCAGCFEALTTVCTEQDDTLAEQRCVALTDDGVHAAAMLLSAYRAGAGCRLSQADAAWVRNVIADSENFLPDLLREVAWGPTRLPAW